MPGLKHGRKKEFLKELTDHITAGLSCQCEELLDELYLGTTIMSLVTLLGDDVVDNLVKSGVRIQSKEELRSHTRWFMAFEESTGNLTSAGEGLLKKLGEIYAEYDNTSKVDQQEDQQQYTFISEEIPAASFYQTGGQ
jgi:hypothetical protein